MIDNELQIHFSFQHTCLQITESYICRIQDVNPIINAVVEDRFLDAIQDAKRVDALIESNILRADELRRKYPLLGVPMTVKESIGVKGLSNGAGYNFDQKRVAEEDAEVVRLCREAGAIVLVVSNTPILCLSTETSNNVTGRTLNPYDTRRSPGGSSGGEVSYTNTKNNGGFELNWFSDVRREEFVIADVSPSIIGCVVDSK